MLSALKVLTYELCRLNSICLFLTRIENLDPVAKFNSHSAAFKYYIIT